MTKKITVAFLIAVLFIAVLMLTACSLIPPEYIEIYLEEQVITGERITKYIGESFVLETDADVVWQVSQPSVLNMATPGVFHPWLPHTNVIISAISNIDPTVRSRVYLEILLPDFTPPYIPVLEPPVRPTPPYEPTPQPPNPEDFEVDFDLMRAFFTLEGFSSRETEGNEGFVAATTVHTFTINRYNDVVEANLGYLAAGLMIAVSPLNMRRERLGYYVWFGTYHSMDLFYAMVTGAWSAPEPDEEHPELGMPTVDELIEIFEFHGWWDNPSRFAPNWSSPPPNSFPHQRLLVNSPGSPATVVLTMRVFETPLHAQLHVNAMYNNPAQPYYYLYGRFAWHGDQIGLDFLYMARRGILPEQPEIVPQTIEQLEALLYMLQDWETFSVHEILDSTVTLSHVVQTGNRQYNQALLGWEFFEYRNGNFTHYQRVLAPVFPPTFPLPTMLNPVPAPNFSFSTLGDFIGFLPPAHEFAHAYGGFSHTTIGGNMLALQLNFSRGGHMTIRFQRTLGGGGTLSDYEFRIRWLMPTAPDLGV